MECQKKIESNQCFSYPRYVCCEGCTVVEENTLGKWGFENNVRCGIKYSCFGSSGSGSNNTSKNLYEFTYK